MLTLRLIRREAQVAWPVAVVLALLAVLLTAIPLSWPPRADRLAAGALADRVARAQLSGPLIAAGTTTTPLPNMPRLPGGRLDQELDRVGNGLRAAAAPRLAAVLGRLQGRVTTADATAVGPGLPTPYGRAPRVSLAYAQPDGPGGPVQYVQGRAPRQPAADRGTPPAEPAPIEVAVSEATRERLGLTVNQQFDLWGSGWATPVLLVGVFRTDQGAGRLWQQFPLLVEPMTAMEVTGQELNGQLLTSAGGIEQTASRGTVPLQLAWDLPVATDRAGPAATPSAIAELRSAIAGLRAAATTRLCGAESDEACLVAGQLVPSVGLADRLTAELDAFTAQQRRTGQLQGFALAGVLAVVVATAVAAARLGARRRAGAFALQLSRGAGLSGIAGRLLAEAAVAVGAGVAVGWAVGRALAPPGAALGSPVPVLVAALLVWCAPAAVLLASAGRTRPVPRSRRLVLEAVVLLPAVGGLVALRARGAFAGSGVDLQLALTPVLLALVVVLALIRLLPLVLLPAAGWARRLRGPVPLVALARAGTHSGAAALALLVLVLATGYGVFGGMVSRALADSRAQTADWRTGGAPAALVGPRDRLPGDLSQARTVGHQATVTGAAGELTSQDDGTTVQGAQLVGLDAAALGAADPSSPVARALLAADEVNAPVGRAGENGAPPVLTALADPGLAARFPDGLFEVAALGMSRSLVQLVGALPDEALRDPVLGPVLGDGPRPRALLLFTGPSAKRLPVQNGHPSAVLLYPAAGGPRLDPAAVRTAAAVQLAPTGATGPRVELRDRDEEFNALRSDGLIRSVELAFRVTTGLGLMLALGAVALDLLLSAAERARTTSYLRTLGLGRRAVLGLQLLQVLPLLVAAAVGGTALGLLLPGALGPGLRLGALTGGPFEPATHIDWTTTTALGVALAVLVLTAAALEAAISRRRGLGAVLRLGEAV
ncbi:hypothetical protein J5Y04_18175 [Kitasatospora sp. RG8]|uniref:hypothetical protein n=1 Tax=Kitasatospora sp. RG8 TaxID=2820815 RepID=UPI001AE06E4F|nr:hypothetical protein [Kitasatospora sp. RG8]MBP0451458.1 hypothetical protein [Kitasatospora sp. RG8]